MAHLHYAHILREPQPQLRQTLVHHIKGAILSLHIALHACT